MKTKEIVNFLNQGISDAGGQANDLALIEPAWLIKIGKRAARKGIKSRPQRATVLSFSVRPISDLGEGLAKGFNAHFKPLEKVVTLSKISREKNVFVVLPEPKARISWDAIPVFLAKYGLRPCRNGPNYLLGLMAALREIPSKLNKKHILAAEPENPNSLFPVRLHSPCCLYARVHDSLRELNAVLAARSWGPEWCFLAEKLK